MQKSLIEINTADFSPEIPWRQVVGTFDHNGYMTLLAWMKDNGIRKFDGVEVETMERFLREWKDCRKMHMGRWHKADCGFPFTDDATCNC